MAKEIITKKDKDNGNNGKPDIRNRKNKLIDVETLRTLTTAYLDEGFDEDTYIDMVDNILKNLKKEQKRKQKDPTAKKVEILGSDTLNDYQRSYLIGIGEQIKRDINIQIELYL